MRKISTRGRALPCALALLTAAALANVAASGVSTYATPAAAYTVVNLFARDGSAAEPFSGATPLLFTVTLSTPATAGGITVNYATADDTGGAHPATGGAACDNSTVDYVTTSGTLTFAPDEQVKTVSVNVCADSANPETSETLLLNLSGSSGGNVVDTQIVDGQAVGSITQGAAAGALLISELRTSGPGGLGDDFVELYNNTDAQLTVAASDASSGYGVYKMGADCGFPPVLVAAVPNGTVIPARGHYLLVGSQYGLSSYAAGDRTLTSDIESDRNVAVFSTADVTNISVATRLDAVGFGSNTGGGVCDLLREGNTLGATAGSALQHSFFRHECDYVAGVGCAADGNPKDTNNNAADFLFADTTGANVSGVGQRLGAPGPEGSASPVRRDASGVLLPFLDQTKSTSLAPNRVRDTTSNPGNNSTFGTLSIRRRVQNTTGAAVTRLRFRVIDLTTFPTPGGGAADLRAINSSSVVISGVNDTTTCTSTGAPATAPCTVTAQATALETPPNQPNGGGYNSTLSLTLPGGGLANNASMDVNFTFGVQTSGAFRFFIIIEALP
jgi:hypothetical protein